MAMLDESIDKREKYRRKYYRKPVESVMSLQGRTSEHGVLFFFSRKSQVLI